MAQAFDKDYVAPDWNANFFYDSDTSNASSENSNLCEEDVVIDFTHGSTSLCNRCSAMLSTIENLRKLTSCEGYEHHTAAGQKKAADIGCSFCKEVLFKGKKDNCFDEDNPHERMRFFARREGTKDENFLHVPLMEEAFSEIDGYEPAEYPFKKWKIAGIGCGTEDVGFNVTLKSVLVESNSPAAAFVERRLPVTDVNSPAVLAQARQWLDECFDGHPDCPRRQVPKLPTRVIDVGKFGEEAFIRLHVSKPDEHADYVALSYCWGGPQTFITVKANLKSNTEGFLGDSLPKTIRGAIYVTRSLGIRYLWVDAFCIIQDSIEDKIIELDSMASIYKDATVTISAACAMSVNDGFLGNQASQMKKAYDFPFVLPDGGMTTVSIIGFDVGKEFHEPLDKRAWCFQESMLSPRRLTFGLRDLLWNCQSVQNKPISRSNTTYYSDLRQLPRRVFKRDYPDTSTETEKLRIWNSIVQGFTMRDISFPDDRLPAISGVINELALAWNDINIHGMMEKMILRQLAWLSTYRGWKPTEITRSDRAPSWSWVSTDGEILFRELDKMDAKLISIEKAPDTKDYQRYRENGKIVLEAKTLSMSNYPAEFFQKNKKFISADDGKRYSIGNNTTFVLLGSSEIEGEMTLILRKRPDGFYERVGLFEDDLESDSAYAMPSGISATLNAATPVRVEIL